jgi:8-oxo-dGTP pyrophosphatase MutT (NUDIX family)
MESIEKAMIREIYEEIGIRVKDLKMVFSQQSKKIEERKTYLNFFFEIISYSGNISNEETDKC